MGASTPPSDVLVGVPAGLVCLAAAMHGARRFRSGLGVGVVWATAGGFVGMRFVPSVIALFTPLGRAVGVLAHVALSAAQSLGWGLAMGLSAALVGAGRVPREPAFALGVMGALLAPSVFPWSPAALLAPWTPLVQAADLVGERGVSALLALAAALVVRGAALRPGRGGAGTRFAGAALLGGALLVYGGLALQRWTAPAEPRVRLALVHAAVDPRGRWEARNHAAILRTLKEQTAAAERAGVELSIWPEAAYPHPLAHDARALAPGPRSVLGDGVRGPVLFGLITADRPARQPDGKLVTDRYNSATLVTPDGALQAPYDKMVLLWFGETVPGGELFPWLRRAFQRSGGLRPGAEMRPLRHAHAAGEARLAVLNCYEDTLTDLGRRAARELAPELLVNVTNDAWFVGTAEPELHLRLSILRSVELRRDLVRAVNLGVAAWIDAAGVVRARRSSPTPGWLDAWPALRREPPTLYVRLGDAPMLLALATLAGAGAWRRRSRPPEASG
jgi:apolipoprotein N-acyltransferase